MIRLLTAVFLFASFGALAQTQVPNVFEDGTSASAAEVNENFDALEAALPPSNCSTDHIIKWDGLAWVCATDPFAGLDCDVGGYLKMGSDGWQCVYCSTEEEHEGEEGEDEHHDEDQHGDCLGV